MSPSWLRQVHDELLGAATMNLNRKEFVRCYDFTKPTNDAAATLTVFTHGLSFRREPGDKPSDDDEAGGRGLEEGSSGSFWLITSRGLSQRRDLQRAQHSGRVAILGIHW